MPAMKKLPLLLAALVAAPCAGAAAGDAFSCPVATLPSGKPARVQSIGVFDGPPAEQAQLVPDNADSRSKEPDYWTFSGQEHGIWVLCQYRGLKRTSQFPLPKAYAKCRLDRKNHTDSLSCE